MTHYTQVRERARLFAGVYGDAARKEHFYVAAAAGCRACWEQMRKLAAVEEARVLMNEGRNWGVWKWLLEKRTVREAADRATEALAEAAKNVKQSWSDDLMKSYREAAAEAALDRGGSGAKRKYEKAREEAKDIDPKIKAVAARVWEADEEARRSTADAEEMFAEAERRMSTSMAREAAEKALESYDARERAIRKAEAAGRKSL